MGFMQWYHSNKASSFRSLISTGFVLCCLIGLVGHAGRVLCVGESGHRSIESALTGCCADPQSIAPSISTASLLNPAPSGPESHCGRCVDIPLISPSFKSQPATRGVKVDYQQCAVVALFTHASLDANEVAKHLVRADTRTRGSSSRALRSTVILI